MKPYEHNRCNKAQGILNQRFVLVPHCHPNTVGSPVIRRFQCLNHSPRPVSILPMSASPMLWIKPSSPLASLVSERRILCHLRLTPPDGVLPSHSNPLESLHHYQPIATHCDLILQSQNRNLAVGQL
jgi:hypothetical protein